MRQPIFLSQWPLVIDSWRLFWCCNKNSACAPLTPQDLDSVKHWRFMAVRTGFHNVMFKLSPCILSSIYVVCRHIVSIKSKSILPVSVISTAILPARCYSYIANVFRGPIVQHKIKASSSPGENISFRSNTWVTGEKQVKTVKKKTSLGLGKETIGFHRKSWGKTMNSAGRLAKGSSGSRWSLKHFIC